MVSKTSETVVMSYHRVMVRRRITSGDEVLELALDVGEQARRADAEQVGGEPAIAQLFLHQDLPLQRGLGGPDPARRLEPYGVAGALVIIADHPGHHDTDR